MRGQSSRRIGPLDAARLLSFLKLQEERDTLAERLDERAILDTKRHSRIGAQGAEGIAEAPGPLGRHVRRVFRHSPIWPERDAAGRVEL